jgi:hypothetical protein
MVVAPAGGLVDYSKNGEKLKRDRQVKRSKSTRDPQLYYFGKSLLVWI